MKGRTLLIDGYNLGLEKGTGVATYARNLSYEIANLGHRVSVVYGNSLGTSRNPLMREIGFFDSGERERNPVAVWAEKLQRIFPRPLGLGAIEVPVTGKVVSRTFDARLPRFDQLFNVHDGFRRAQMAFQLWGGLTTMKMPERPDLAHWTYPLPVRIGKVPNIYTLHDLVPLRLPYTTLDNKRRYLKLLQELDKRADHFVTVSECSKRDLIDLVGIAPERITNTYQSVSIPAKYRDKDEATVAREVEGAAGVGYKDYYLFWGSIEPKKNIGRMIEAYLASKVTAPLVIVGAQAWKSEQELRLLNDENVTFLRSIGDETFTRKRVIQLTYAPFSLLVSLIRGAKAALFPSLYEGFGLPALEAMLLGTPVICTQTSSLPEVVGDAAEMIDPYDPAAIAAAIRKIDADEDWRAELSRRGPAQAARFSPEIYRGRLKEVYDKFL